MPTEKEIKATYKQLHDELSEIYYDGTMGLTKEAFDTQHGMIWDTMTDELIAGGHITIPEQPRDLAAELTAQKVEIDELKERLTERGIL